MFRTFKKALAIVLTVVFVLSLIPTFALAEDSVKLGFSYPVSIRDYGDNQVRDYSVGLRAGTVGNQYKGFLQLDFSGYEYLLGDESSNILVTLGCGVRIGSATMYLYDCGLFILDDANDVYADHYEIYSDAQNCMSSGEVLQYITPLTTIEGVTPFVSRVDSAAASTYTSDGNKQLILDALDASTDDSVVTFQYIQLTSESGASNKLGLANSSDRTFITINSAGEDATPANYLSDISNELNWDKFSSEGIRNVVSNLNLPTKYKGVEIEWVSSNKDALNPQTGVVTVDNTRNTYVTLTANLTYTGYTGEVASESKQFDIRIPKPAYDFSSGAGTYYNGDINFFAHSGSGATHNPTITKVGGIAGKTAEDISYEIRDASGNRRYSIPESSSNILDRDIIEFSVCVPSDAYGFSLVMPMQMNINDGGEYDAYQSSLTFEHDGVHNSRSGRYIFPWNGNQWHHIAIVSPGIVSSDASGIVYDKHLIIYVDGVEVYNVEMSSYVAPYGFRYAYLNGLCPISTYDAETKTFSSVAGYVDDLRWTSDLFNADYHTVSSVSSAYDIDGDIITLLEDGLTAKDIVDSLTIDDDAVARVYDASWNLLADDAAVATGNVLVVADTNGTTSERSYAYYDINVVDDGEIEFDDPYITVEDDMISGTVKLFNRSGEIATCFVYLAVYDGDELAELVPVVLSAADGSTASVTTTPINLAEGNTAKLMVLEDDGINPALKHVYYE